MLPAPPSAGPLRAGSHLLVNLCGRQDSLHRCQRCGALRRAGRYALLHGRLSGRHGCNRALRPGRRCISCLAAAAAAACSSAGQLRGVLGVPARPASQLQQLAQAQRRAARPWRSASRCVQALARWGFSCPAQACARPTVRVGWLSQLPRAGADLPAHLLAAACLRAWTRRRARIWVF